MIVTVFLAALQIAFPKEGSSFPSVSQCYVIGSVDPGVTNIVFRGASVPVHSNGAWAVMAPVTPGRNVVEIGSARVSFTVAKPPAPKPVGLPPADPKPLPALAYAADAPATNVSRTICLDPGHGGPADTGAMSPHALPEKDANLLMALAVKPELEARGFTVVLTRASDVAVPLYDRPKAAHRQKAAAFVSIHHNAPPVDRDPSCLRYHAVYSWNPLGEALAKAINVRMGAAFGDTLKNNGVMHANFAVTRSPEIPSCLIEVDFITSFDGEVASWDPDRRKLTAAAIAAGIDDWYASRCAGIVQEDSGKVTGGK